MIYVIDGKVIEADDEDELRITLQDLQLTDVYTAEMRKQLFGDEEWLTHKIKIGGIVWNIM